MNATKTDLLPVPGASLYYEVRGSGPVLLISQSGEGDAGRSRQLVDLLVEQYTVVTYDRRGLSRSKLDARAEPVTLEAHADDVHRLLAAVTDKPALMLGCSMGAIIGLELAVRHPGQLSTLIAHEPVGLRLLPDAERVHAQRELRDVQDTFRQQGWTAATRKVATILGIKLENQEVEPGVEPAPLTPERRANFEFFLEHDITAALNGTLSVEDLATLKGGPTRIVPAGGRTTPRTVFDYRCAQEVASHLGTGLVEFPGGHNGNLTHPRAYAARLREVLE